MLDNLRILVAPGPFKECLEAEQVADAIASGLQRGLPASRITKLPMSDGGTGLVKRIVEHSNGEIKKCVVRGPVGDLVDAYYGIVQKSDKKIGVVESAAAAGLALVPPDQRNPIITTTFGVGQLILKALDEGCDEIIVGCGDSATNDGGFGMASALGISFTNSAGNELTLGGGSLTNLSQINMTALDPRIAKTKFIVACNLTSILCGPEGTSYKYAPQKGADAEMTKYLANALEKYAQVIRTTTGKDVRYIPGAGGSGGLGAALYTFLNAKLQFSMHVVTAFLDLESYLRNADLVITGEGKVDAATAGGKVACAIALLAKKYELPTIAITGSISDDASIVYYNGLDHVEPICYRPVSLEESMNRAQEWIEEASLRVTRLLRVSNMLIRHPTRLQ